MKAVLVSFVTGSGEQLVSIPGKLDLSGCARLWTEMSSSVVLVVIGTVSVPVGCSILDY